MSGANKSPRSKQKIMTAETFGMVLALFSVLLLVVVVTGDRLLGDFGKTIASFMYGVFGYTAFAVIFTLLYSGIALVTGKRIRGKVSVQFFAIAALVFLVCAFHAGVGNGIEAKDFSSYVNACYDAGANPLKYVTFGGGLAAIVVFPLLHLTSRIGSIILFLFLALVCGYSALVYAKGRSAIAQKKRREQPSAEGGVYLEKPEEIAGIKAYPNADFDFDEEDSRQNVASNTERYFGNAPFELKTKKDYKKGKNDARSESLQILYPDRGNGNLDFVRAQSDSTYSDTYQRDFSEKVNYIKTPPPILPQQLRAEKTDRVEPRKPVAGSNIPRYDHDESPRPPAVGQNPAPSSIPPAYREEKQIPPAKTEEIGGEMPLTDDDVMPTRIPGIEKYPYRPTEEQPSRPVETPSDRVDFSRGGFSGNTELPRDIPVSFGGTSSEGYSAPRAVDPGLEEPVDDAVVDPFDKGEDPVADIRPPLSRPASTVSEKKSVPTPQSAPVADEMPLIYHYTAPPLDFLNDYETNTDNLARENEERTHIIEDTLSGFNIPATVVNVTNGAAFTRFELSLPPNISVKRVLPYADDIAMRVQATEGIRIEAPIPGKDLVGVEVANNTRLTVGLKSIMRETKFRCSSAGSLTFALGQNISGQGVVCDITEMPHLLVAGSTGTGKSVCLSTMIASLICKYSPEDLRLVLVDPKQVEFSMFKNIPHLLIAEPIVDINKAIAAFKWAVEEMDRRYQLFSQAEVKNLEEYNEYRTPGSRKLSKIVIIVDELNDLMIKREHKRDMESVIVSLAQKARAAGIHLVLATQRPSVDVITGVIKANLPSRIAFRVTNAADSITILGEGGAEHLTGKGDLLFRDAKMQKPLRLQGPFISNPELKKIVGFIKEHNTSYFDHAVEALLEKASKPQEDPEAMERGEGGGRLSADQDPLFVEALKEVIMQGSASTSMLQRRLRIGYSRAGSLIDQMSEMNYISAFEGNKIRKVLITLEEFNELYGEGND